MTRGSARIGVMTGVAMVAATLAACSGGGGGDKGKAPAAANNAAAPANTAASTPAPAAGDTATLTGATLAQFTGHADAGRTVFAQCTACHSPDAGQNRVGPSLHAVVGRRAGTIAGFSYSDANKNSGITWSPEKLFQYLERPQRVVPGTKMTFAGLSDPQQRADVIAYLQTLQ